MNDSILLADAETVIKVVGGIIVALIYVVNHIVGATGKVQQRRQMRPEARPDPRAARPRPAVPGGRQEVQDEVAELLKRAAEKRSSTKQPPAPQRRPVSPASPEIVEARAVHEIPSSRWPNAVPTHVGSRDLAQRTEQLAHVDRGEAAFQAHMQVFEHQVGRINESDANSPAPLDVRDAGPQTINAPPNEVFAALLSDPQSLRQAIILNEIIARPVERW